MSERRRSELDDLVEQGAGPAGSFNIGFRPVPKRPWKCIRCSASAASERGLKRHYAIRHPLPPRKRQPWSRTGAFSCPSCSSAYPTEADRDMHINARHGMRLTD